MKKMLAGSLLALLLGAAFFLFSSCAENRRTPFQQSAPPSAGNGKPAEPALSPEEESAQEFPALSDDQNLEPRLPPEALEHFLPLRVHPLRRSRHCGRGVRILEDFTNPLYNMKGRRSTSLEDRHRPPP